MTSVILPQKLAKFDRLYQEFAKGYLNMPAGREHGAAYIGLRRTAHHHYQAIMAKANAGEDITDAVLLKFLPYADTSGNRERDAWIHVAPAVMGDIRKWHSAAGWTRPQDWPAIARAILRFVNRTFELPIQLDQACKEFSALPYTKGMQSGMLTPILNALRPDEFLLLNNKSRTVLNYFTDAGASQTLIEYPAANAALKSLVAALPALHQQAERLSLRPADLFELFCHWLVSVKQYRLRAVRYWALAAGEDAWQWQDWQEGQYAAIGWDELGDLSGIDKREFEQRRDSLVAQYTDWTKSGANQVWRFARQLHEGDRIVVYLRVPLPEGQATHVILGIGSVTGSYFFAPEMSLGHRLPVAWDDRTARTVSGISWRNTLTAIDQSTFETVSRAPVAPAELHRLFMASLATDKPEAPAISALLHADRGDFAGNGRHGRGRFGHRTSFGAGRSVPSRTHQHLAQRRKPDA